MGAIFLFLFFMWIFKGFGKAMRPRRKSADSRLPKLDYFLA